MKFTAPQLKLLNESDEKLRRLERLEAAGDLDPSDTEVLRRLRTRVSTDTQLINPSRELIEQIIKDYQTNGEAGCAVRAVTWPMIYWDSTMLDFGMEGMDLYEKLYKAIYSKKAIPDGVDQRTSNPAVISFDLWPFHPNSLDTSLPIGSLIVAIYPIRQQAENWIKEFNV